MSVRARVVQTWQRLTNRQRPILRNQSIRSGDGGCRLRCKVIMALVRGKTPSQLAAGGRCAGSQVSRLAHRFLDDGLRGIADRREDNGQPEVHARYASQLLAVVAGSPQEHGSLRPTGTQGLLSLVVAERTGVTISVATMSRLLKRLQVRLGRPEPIV